MRTAGFGELLQLVGRKWSFAVELFGLGWFLVGRAAFLPLMLLDVGEFLGPVGMKESFRVELLSGWIPGGHAAFLGLMIVSVDNLG